MKAIAMLSISAALVLAGCQNQEKETAESVQLDQISSQLQQLTAEVVRLQKQVADLTAEDVQAAGPAAGLRRIDLSLSSTVQQMGDTKVEYAIVEFMDYQCPYCVRHAQQTLPALKRKYIDSGLVQYIVKDFPLEFHAQAESAAVAARCAARQGQFAAMHFSLIEHSRSLSPAVYTELAVNLDLDQQQFDHCINDSSMLTDLQNEVTEAVRLGVTGTPRFLVGRIEGDELVDFISISGAQSMERFEEALQRAFNQGA